MRKHSQGVCGKGGKEQLNNNSMVSKIHYRVKETLKYYQTICVFESKRHKWIHHENNNKNKLHRLYWHHTKST